MPRARTSHDSQVVGMEIYFLNHSKFSAPIRHSMIASVAVIERTLPLSSRGFLQIGFLARLAHAFSFAINAFYILREGFSILTLHNKCILIAVIL